MHFQYVATNFTTLHIPAKQLDIISETIERKNPTIHPREEVIKERTNLPLLSSHHRPKKNEIQPWTDISVPCHDQFYPHRATAPNIDLLPSFPKRGSRNDGFACAILCNGLQLTYPAAYVSRTKKVPRVRDDEGEATEDWY